MATTESVDLFAEQRRASLDQVAPLAVRMRPRTLDEFVGQTHFLGEGKLLRRMLESDRMTSAIFHGPPGTGKTTLARVIASATRAHFEEVNAAEVGVKEIRALLSEARRRLEDGAARTILFVDELHHFSRSQQDVLLGDVERGIVVLLAATTENPFFALQGPLISRSQVFRFEPLSEKEIRGLLLAALRDSDRGFGRFEVTLTEDAADHLARTSDGDARRALTALEIAVLSQTDPASEGRPIVIDLATAADSIQRKALCYDARGDGHYDAISAMIKSIRGSDPDAAVYWLATMLEAGEDPRFVARRLVIAAAEDIGNADPRGLILAQAAADATRMIGMPECQFPLAQAALYLACAAKSNASAEAIRAAAEDVRSGRTLPVPKPLRGGGSAWSSKRDFGEGEPCSQEAGAGRVSQDSFGVEKVYYTPTDRGAEAVVRRYLQAARDQRSGGERG